MHYLGKLIAFLFALLIGASLGSLLILIFIGHFIDFLINSSRRINYSSKQRERQTLFLRTTFQVLGHLAKAKGKVTSLDIQLATALMDKMGLDNAARILAQTAFREGKLVDFPLRQQLKALRIACLGRFDLRQMFLEIQCEAVMADGVIHPQERTVLYIIAEELEFSRTQFDLFLQMMEARSRFFYRYQENSSTYHDQQQSDHYSNYQRQQPGEQRGQRSFTDACKILGVATDADTTTIKRAYKKLMNQHHPDKLVAKGLPPEMINMAKQKTQEIKAAYDLIKREKGMS